MSKAVTSLVCQRSLRLPLGIVIDDQHWPPIFSADTVRSAKSIKPRSDDVFICTYPKCGTTWMQHIVHQLIGKTDYERIVDENANEEQTSSKALCYISPMIERFGSGFIDSLESPRVLKTHFNYQDIPKGGSAKYIYVVRNPKDCLISYYHHHKNFKFYDFENGDFEVFFDLFMEGKVGVGDYFDHLQSWKEGIDQNKEEILLIKYEDMVNDLHSSVVRVAAFLGGEAENLVQNKQSLERIVEASTLKSMKKNQQRWFPIDSHHGEFIRKGGSRDWKNYFDYEQSMSMDQRFRQCCTGSDAADWWNSEMAWDEVKMN